MLKQITVGLFSIGLMYYIDMIGTYQSPPYVSSILLEPSKITTKLNNDGKYGFCMSYTYMAFYINPIPPNELSTVFYLTLPRNGKSLKDETYFNKFGRH